MSEFYLARPCQSEILAPGQGRCRMAKEATEALGKVLVGKTIDAAYCGYVPQAEDTLHDLLVGAQMKKPHDIQCFKELSVRDPNVPLIHEGVVLPQLKAGNTVLVVPDITVYRDYIEHLELSQYVNMNEHLRDRPIMHRFAVSDELGLRRTVDY